MSLAEHLPDAFSIKDFSVESDPRGREILFDPACDITEDDWQAMEVRLEELKTSGQWASALEMYWCLSMVSSEHPRPLPLTESDWRTIFAVLGLEAPGALANEIGWANYARKIRDVKYISPEKYQILQKEAEKIWNYFSIYREGEEAKHNWSAVLAAAFLLLGLFPSRADEIKNHKPELWPHIFTLLQSDLQTVVASPADSLFHYKKSLVRAQLLYPEKKGMLTPLPQTREALRDDFLTLRRYCMNKTTLGDFTRFDWPEFADTAVDLLIISAHEAKVTEEGIKITLRPPELLQSPVPGIPQTRKF
jgi:hypothetical protein